MPTPARRVSVPLAVLAQDGGAEVAVQAADDASRATLVLPSVAAVR
jgi:hypothetical protein